MANGQDFLSRGSLKIQVINIRNNYPIQNAKVSISSKGEPERVLEQLTTDSSGQTENICLMIRNGINRRYTYGSIYRKSVGTGR